MQSELAKSKPSNLLINERMARTFGHRRSLIEISTVDEVLRQFPALGLEDQVLTVLISLTFEGVEGMNVVVRLV
jgi:hypothetical protein